MGLLCTGSLHSVGIGMTRKECHGDSRVILACLTVLSGSIDMRRSAVAVCRRFHALRGRRSPRRRGAGWIQSDDSCACLLLRSRTETVKRGRGGGECTRAGELSGETLAGVAVRSSSGEIPTPGRTILLLGGAENPIRWRSGATEKARASVEGFRFESESAARRGVSAARGMPRVPPVDLRSRDEDC
jgi:hypothetical protein